MASLAPALADAERTVTRARFLAARIAGRRDIYEQLLRLHDEADEDGRPAAALLIKAVCGLHPYHFLTTADRVLPLYHLTAQRQRVRSLYFPPEHAAIYPAPPFSEFGPPDYVDSVGNGYREEPSLPGVLLVRLTRTKRRQAVGPQENPWNLPLPSEPLMLRVQGGTAKAEIIVTTSVFDTQAGYVPRKTGTITFIGELPIAAPGSATGERRFRPGRKRPRPTAD